MKKSFLILAIGLLMMFCVNAEAATSVKSVPKLAVSKTPDENVFCVKGSGREFIMLDFDEKGVFVLAKEFYGYHVFDPDENGKFDPLDTNNIAYWLNNDFLESGNAGKEIPSEMKKYINTVSWHTEGGHNSTSFSADYEAVCKIALLSQTEWSKYVGKFGYSDDIEYTQNLSYYLRSTDSSKVPSSSKSNVIIARLSKKGGTTEAASSTKKYLVRPCFYLSYDFFENVCIDINAAGDNVRSFMTDKFQRDTLGKIYTNEELDVIYNAEYAPQITFLTVEGLPVPGYKLSCPKNCYEYYSPTGEAEGIHSYRWIRTEDSGERTVSETAEYTLTADDGGHYITLELSPRSVSGKLGKPRYYSVYVEKAVKPKALNLHITGKSVCGEVLYINYNYYDENDDYEADTKFEWQRSADGVSYDSIVGANSSEYVLSDSDSGFFIRAAVTPISYGALCDGETAYSQSVGKVKYYPKAEDVSIGVSKNSFLGSYKKVSVEEYDTEDEMYWEVSDNEDFGFLRIDGSEGNIFTPSAVYNGKYIRYTVVPCGINGASIRSYSSRSVLVSGIKEAVPIKISNSVYVKGEKNVKLFSADEKEAYAVSFVIKNDGDAEFDVSGCGYEVFTETVSDGLLCVLTKLGKTSAVTGDFPLAEIRIVSAKGANVSIENAVSGNLVNAGKTDICDIALTMVEVDNFDYEWHFYDEGRELIKPDINTLKRCGLNANVNIISQNQSSSKAVPIAAFYDSDGILIAKFNGNTVGFEPGVGILKTVKISISAEEIPSDTAMIKLYVFNAEAILQPMREITEIN